MNVSMCVGLAPVPFEFMRMLVVFIVNMRMRMFVAFVGVPMLMPLGDV